MGSSASLDDLPSEMISELFKYLQTSDLAACSMVNKRWHSIYTDFKLERLVVIGDDTYLQFNKWSHPDRKVEEKAKLCHIEAFRGLASKPFLSNLKHLALCGILSESYFKFDLNILNRFRQLVHLEFKTYLGRNQVDLNLPKLRVLAIHLRNRFCPLLIDCPELSVLVYQKELLGKNLFKVKHPETIEKLETDMVNADLTRFKSVECLVTRSFEAINRKTLLSLPKLKELHYKVGIAELFDRYKMQIDRVKQTLREFLGKVELLRRPDFKFTFAGFQLTKTTLDEIDFGVQMLKRSVTSSNEYVYMKNCQLVDPDATLDFIRVLDYTRLMINAPETIPSGFFRKFSRVKKVHVRGALQDERHFLEFLMSLSWLRSLDLEGSQLSQAFYDQLPVSAHSLDTLGFLGNRQELRLNFDFIGKFPRLSSLFMFPNLYFESFSSLMSSSGKLVECFVRVLLKEKSFFIRKKRSSKEWMIFETSYSCSGTMVYETQHPDVVLNYLKSSVVQQNFNGLIN